MKNKEYLETLSNNELAPYLVFSPCGICTNMNCDTEMNCAHGISKWLEKECTITLTRKEQ